MANLVARRFCRFIAKATARSEAKRMQLRFMENYRSLLGNLPTQTNRALEKHLVGMIVPTIALTQVLQADGCESGAIQDWLKSFYRAYFRRTRYVYKLCGKMPGFFGLLRVLLRATMRNVYPESGWSRIWREDSPHCLAFDMRSCYYQDVLRQFGEEYLLGVFCQIDDDLYQGMSSRVLWGRTTTLAFNGDCCDFRFTKKSNNRQENHR